MTFARVAGILFLASLTATFGLIEASEVLRTGAAVMTMVTALLCAGVLMMLARREALSAGAAGAACGAAVWLVAGLLYLKYLSPPSDIGGALIAGLGIPAMLVVAGWMILDEDLVAPTD